MTSNRSWSQSFSAIFFLTASPQRSESWNHVESVTPATHLIWLHNLAYNSQSYCMDIKSQNNGNKYMASEYLKWDFIYALSLCILNFVFGNGMSTWISINSEIHSMDQLPQSLRMLKGSTSMQLGMCPPPPTKCPKNICGLHCCQHLLRLGLRPGISYFKLLSQNDSKDTRWKGLEAVSLWPGDQDNWMDSRSKLR